MALLPTGKLPSLYYNCIKIESEPVMHPDQHAFAISSLPRYPFLFIGLCVMVRGMIDLSRRQLLRGERNRAFIVGNFAWDERFREFSAKSVDCR